MEYTDDYYDSNGYGYGKNHDGCVLVINMKSRDWWLSTLLTDSRTESLLKPC